MLATKLICLEHKRPNPGSNPGAAMHGGICRCPHTNGGTMKQSVKEFIWIAILILGMLIAGMSIPEPTETTREAWEVWG